LPADRSCFSNCWICSHAGLTGQLFGRQRGEEVLLPSSETNSCK
jgi:hypothetical protein